MVKDQSLGRYRFENKIRDLNLNHKGIRITELWTVEKWSLKLHFKRKKKERTI